MKDHTNTFPFDPGGMITLTIMLMILTVCVGIYLQLERLTGDLDRKENAAELSERYDDFLQNWDEILATGVVRGDSQ